MLLLSFWIPRIQQPGCSQNEIAINMMNSAAKLETIMSFMWIERLYHFYQKGVFKIRLWKLWVFFVVWGRAFYLFLEADTLNYFIFMLYKYYLLIYNICTVPTFKEDSRQHIAHVFQLFLFFSWKQYSLIEDLEC